MSTNKNIELPHARHSLQAVVIRRSPRDAAGRIIKRGPCDVCGYGNLQYEGNGIWQCDGLADPENDREELIQCPRYHFDGEAPYNK
jgi:hypothetical protein